MEFLNFCAGDCIVVELRVEKICDDPERLISFRRRQKDTGAQTGSVLASIGISSLDTGLSPKVTGTRRTSWLDTLRAFFCTSGVEIFSWLIVLNLLIDWDCEDHVSAGDVSSKESGIRCLLPPVLAG